MFEFFDCEFDLTPESCSRCYVNIWREKTAKGGKTMARKNYSPEQIIRMLRETEVYIGEGMTAREAARQIGVTEQTYYRWRKEYGGMQISQAKRLKVLEKENIRLKRLVAEKELDIQILRETIAFESKNF
jgi:transposase-like protein